jgi:eukaryotic-like serine/threonine-protein kinase
MNVARGVTLGPYEVLAHIGAGGMGDVWRARDQRIGRDVAIKVLNDSYAPGDERVRRFEQEARAAGALNHPGLVTILDVGTMDGSPYIVMELLEGETLRDAIGDVMPRPLPLRKTIDYAIQIASALAVAHEKGIIHRDLKPDNLFITSDGRVKILDFGLAKLAEDATDADARHRTARHLTSAGMVVGTPGYMSPEQVRARPLDYRTDIFSLGAVLYEMIAGRRAFDRDSSVETMHAVLSEEPEPLISTVPHALESIVQHCLEKNPRERFQSARDLAFQLRLLPELQNSAADAVQAIPATLKTRLPYRVGIAAVALLALAAGGFAIFHVRGGVSRPDSREYRQLTFAEGVAMFPTISADGKTVAYVSLQSGKRDIYEQRVDGRSAINLTGDSPAESSEPAFSPDGSRIAFRSERDGGGIFVMGASGESVRRRTDFGHNPSWSPDGAHFVVSTAPVELQPNGHRVYGDLWIVDERTGAKRLLFEHGTGNDGGRAVDALQPTWSPHGRRIAFWGVSGSGQRDIWTIDPEAPQPKTTLVRLTSDPALHWNPVWSPDGKSLCFGSDRDGTLNLWRIAVDETTGAPAGEAEPLLLPASFSGHFAFSQQGEMVYTTVTRAFRLLTFPFDVKSGRIGAPRTLFGGSQEILSFEPSPNGESIAFTTAGGQEDVFVARADGTRLRQLTNDAAKDRIVTWSPDAKTLYFYSNRDGAYQIWSVNADGSALARVTDDGDLRRKGAGMIASPTVSPDGRTLAAQTDRFAALVHLDRPLGSRLESLQNAINLPTWSPDGKQLAGNVFKAPGIVVYSLQTGRAEKILDHGANPLWLPDGRHLAVFGKQSVGIVDLDSRRVTTAAIALPPGVQFGGAAITHLSRDGSTLYLRQTLEQGDIWWVRFENQEPTR